MSGRFSLRPRPWRRWQRRIRSEWVVWALEALVFGAIPLTLGWTAGVITVVLFRLPWGVAFLGMAGGVAAGELARRRCCS